MREESSVTSINLGDPDDNTTLPLYDRFFLGGINSLQGFQLGERRALRKQGMSSVA